MEDFKKESIKDIIVEKVNLFKVTQLEANAFWQKLQDDQIFDCGKIIIDLSFCTAVDSTFKGIIVKTFRKIAEKKGRLKLVLPRVPAADTFKLSGITRLIESYENLDSAIESYDAKKQVAKLKLYYAGKSFENVPY